MVSAQPFTLVHICAICEFFQRNLKETVLPDLALPMQRASGVPPAPKFLRLDYVMRRDATDAGKTRVAALYGKRQCPAAQVMEAECGHAKSSSLAACLQCLAGKFGKHNGRCADDAIEQFCSERIPHDNGDQAPHFRRPSLYSVPQQKEAYKMPKNLVNIVPTVKRGRSSSSSPRSDASNPTRLLLSAGGNQSSHTTDGLGPWNVRL